MVEQALASVPLSEQSPVQIDAKLAELVEAANAVERNLDHAVSWLHTVLGERKVHLSRGRSAWPTSHATVEAAVRKLAIEGSEGAPYKQREAAEAIAKLDRYRAALVAAKAAQDPYHDEYDRRPWSRFFLVTSSDGHIHSSLQCSTCRPTTGYKWLPDLSGKTEADAVAAEGTRLCSVCFPSAPVEWTLGIAKPEPAADECSGRGQFAQNIKWYVSPRGTCPVCGASVSVTSTGKARKHAAKGA